MKWRLVCCLLLVAHVSAQDVVFLPTEHLPGYTEAEFSQDRDLYDLRPYEAVRGAKVTPGQLADLKQRWAAEKARVAAELEEIRQDPLAAYAYRQLKWVRRHPFFKDYEFDRNNDHLPLTFFVQRVADRPSGKLLDGLAPVVQRALDDFEDNLAPALGIGARDPEAAVEGHTIVLLGDQDTFFDYCKLFEGGWRGRQRCIYNARTKTLVGWAGAEPDPMLCGDVAFALCHRLLHHRGLDFESRARPLWTTWGLGAWLSAGERLAGARALFGDQVADLSLARETHEVYCCGLEDLLRVRSRREINQALQARSGIAAPDAGTQGSAVRVFYAQVSQLVRHLLGSDDPRLRAGLRAAWQAAVEGEDGAAAFAAAVGGDMNAVATGFWRFVADERRRIEEADPGRAAPAPLAAPRGEGSAAPPRVALQLEGGDWRALVGLAWREAAAGRLDRAAEVLHAAPVPPDPEAAERVRREVARVAAVVALRARVFEEAKAKRALVRFRIDGELVQGYVDEVGDEGVVVRSRSGRSATNLSFSRLPPIQILRQAEAQGLLTGETAAAAAWLATLAGADSGTVDRFLAAAGGDNGMLRGDLRDREELMELAAPAGLLLRITARAAAGAEAAATVELLSELLRDHRQSPLVVARLEPLRVLAEQLLSAAFDPLRPECSGLSQVPERLADGSARWSYDFGDPDQLSDFRVDATYLSDHLSGFVEFLEGHFGAIDAGQEGAFRIEEGALRCRGRSVLRWPMAVVAPFSVRLRVNYSGEGLLMVGVADNGKGDFITCQYIGDLTIRDAPGGVFDEAFRDVQEMYHERDYDIDLRHDGESIACFLDDKRVTVLPRVGTRVGGGVFLWLYSKNEIRVRSLEIVGVPDLERMARVRELWVQDRLRKMFGTQ